MSYIDALIAQGGSRPFDAAGTMSKVNTLQNQQKRNELLDIGIAQAPINQQRATEQYDQEQAEHDRGLLFQASNEFLRSYSVSKESAMQTLAGFPDEGRLGQIKQEALTALQSPDPADDEEVLKQAQMFVQLGTDEGFFKQAGAQEAPAAVQTFNALVGKINDPNTSEVEKQAALVNLGINPRAKGPQVVVAGDVPRYWDPQTQTLSEFDANGQLITPEKVAADKALVSSTVKGAEQAVVQSGKIFEQLGPVYKSVTNINNAISAIDQGADTGAIMSRLPSVTEASVTLDNVRGQMGLDIIGATTFGALSEGELQFALDTAIPTGLDEPALRDWLVKKGKAQKKYAEELRKAAIYLGEPGHTISGYLDALEVSGQYVKGGNEIPQAAIDHLMANPELRDQFMAKYGELPEGF